VDRERSGCTALDLVTGSGRFPITPVPATAGVSPITCVLFGESTWAVTEYFGRRPFSRKV